MVRIIGRPVGPSAEQFSEALLNSVRRYFGEVGLARIDLRMIRYDPAKMLAIIACKKEGLENLQAALGLIPDTPDLAITAITMRVSGTIKGLRRKQRF
jgi:RNase P/RNase MRP subunit POP5